ncbi:cellulase family glycosylhydrolase [Leifsonia xyli]|nr:cellulase family glycosylhydrolase [Leifsonia xyli]
MNFLRRFAASAAFPIALLSIILAVSPATGADARPFASSEKHSEYGWLHTSGSRILTESDAPYVIRGIAWFGMETSACAPHGLWTISLDEGMRKIAQLGFNTVRIPYSNECLSGYNTSTINGNINPDLVNLTPLQLLDRVVDAAHKARLGVFLDRHRPESAAQSPLWYTSKISEGRWIADWGALAARYRENRTVIGVDLHNEPHQPACWGCGDPAVDWRLAATRAGNAVLAVNPNLLVIVEGMEWGGELTGVASAQVALNVSNRVVYSPHDYPQEVADHSWFHDPTYPGNLKKVWSSRWGYIAAQGIAPVLLGEFGTDLQTQSDRLWFKEIVDYLKETGMSFSFWCFNPNSLDTGGIVKSDWRTPEQEKVDILGPILTPQPEPGGSAPGGSAPGGSAPGGSAPGGSAPGGSAPGGSLTVKWSLQGAWNAGYVAELQLTADRPVSGWSVSWESPKAVAVSNSWGMTCGISENRIICSGKDWATNLQPGQTVRVGLQVAAKYAPALPLMSVNTDVHRIIQNKVLFGYLPS